MFCVAKTVADTNIPKDNLLSIKLINLCPSYIEALLFHEPAFCILCYLYTIQLLDLKIHSLFMLDFKCHTGSRPCIRCALL